MGKGVHAIHLDTPSFTDDILALNNEVCGAGGLGGVSLPDITNPLAPALLAQNFGDTTDALGQHRPVCQYHSVFAWQAGRAFVVASDDEEQAQTDVDIVEITDPRNPRLIAETAFTCGGRNPRPIPAICIGHRAFHRGPSPRSM